MRYRKILVALDHSSESNAIFEQALEIAKKEEANLMLFHCMPFENPGIGAAYGDMFAREMINFSYEMQQLFRQEREEAQQWLADCCQKAMEQGIPTEWDLKIGDVGSKIQELASAWNADLIVLGRRGRRGLAEVVLGSVSNYVVHHVPCSVLVVQGVSSTEDDTPEALSKVKSR